MINFTKEHEARLKELFVEVSFKGEELQGKFGADTMTAYDLLHHTSLTSLGTMHTNIKAEIAKEEANTDEWTQTEYKQRLLVQKKKWQELIHLTIGYKRSLAEKAENDKVLREKKNLLKELTENNKTPDQKIADLQKEIAQMEGSPVEENTAPPVNS